MTSNEVQQVLSQKYLMTLRNQQRFLDDVYHESSPFINEAKIDWYSIPVIPQTRHFSINEQIIVNEDNILMALTGLTEKEETLFAIKERTVEFNP